jgi:hypothetical protein
LVACGSTEQYFTGHWLDDGRWDGTHLWFYNEADALAFASTMTGDPAPCPSGPGFVYPPSLSLTVDGDASDWDGVPPVLTDPAGDQNGSASKDITEIGAAMDANRFTVRLRTSGPIALPHSPQSEWSHYSISLHFGSGYGCEQDLDNLSVNNFTQWNGQNWHQGELWNSGWSFRKATYPAQSAHTGDTLEMALSTTVIPIGARSFWIGAQAMSFNPDVAGDNTWSGSDANACYQINVTDLYRAAMQRVYVAYYGRPADPAGAGWWGEQLAANNGNLDALIQQFGTSQEFDERYGSLDYGTLLDTIYQQMFGRFPDPGGKAFYLGKLQSGAMSLQSITLNVLDGSQNEDLQTVANKLEVASYITAQIANRGLDYTSDDIATAWGILSAVNSNLQSADTAIGIADGWLDAKTPL